MRVVLSNSSSRWGGVHKVTEILARGLTERGHDVAVFGYPGGMLEEECAGSFNSSRFSRGWTCIQS